MEWRDIFPPQIGADWIQLSVFLSVEVWLWCFGPFWPSSPRPGLHLLLKAASNWTIHRDSKAEIKPSWILAQWAERSAVTRFPSSGASLGRSGCLASRAANKSATTAWYPHKNMEPNLWGVLPALCWATTKSTWNHLMNWKSAISPRSHSVKEKEHFYQGGSVGPYQG